MIFKNGNKENGEKKQGFSIKKAIKGSVCASIVVGTAIHLASKAGKAVNKNFR